VITIASAAIRWGHSRLAVCAIVVCLAAPAAHGEARPAPLPLAATTASATGGDDLVIAVNLHGVDADRRAPLEQAALEAARTVQGYLQVRLSGRLAVEFVGSDDEFAAVMAAHGVRGWDERWLAGLALLDEARVIVHVNGTRALTTQQTLEHELVHVAMHAAAGGRVLPRWFQEGAAMLLSGEATFDRLRNIAGAAPLGQLDSLADLDAGLLGSAVAKERAYAMAGGFMQFLTQRGGGRDAVGQVQRRVRSGESFDTAFAWTFGQPPSDLYAIYAAQMRASASAWALLLTDDTLWTILSLCAAIALVAAWIRRPKVSNIEPESSPAELDLEAIAAAGEAALKRPWDRRDFRTNPLSVEGDAERGDDNAAGRGDGGDRDLDAPMPDTPAQIQQVVDDSGVENAASAAIAADVGAPVDGRDRAPL